MCVRLAMLVGLFIALGGPSCGGDEARDGASSSQLKDAVAKTEAAKTARMAFDISVSGDVSESFHGKVLVDFEHDRDRLTMDVQGQTLQLISDGSDEYVRQGTAGRYRRFPKS